MNPDLISVMSNGATQRSPAESVFLFGFLDGNAAHWAAGSGDVTIQRPLRPLNSGGKPTSPRLAKTQQTVQQDQVARCRFGWTALNRRKLSASRPRLVGLHGWRQERHAEGYVTRPDDRAETRGVKPHIA